MEPSIPGGRRLGERRQHRLDKAGQGPLGCAFDCARIGRRALAGPRARLGGGRAAALGLLDLSRLRRPARGFAGEVVDRPAGFHRLRALLENVGGPGRAGEFIVALDQKPILALLARLGAHPDQMPATLEFLTVKLEVELALLQAFVRIADRRPCAPVPHDDGAAAVFAFGDRSFEIGVFQRVVFDGDREPLFAGYEARAASHRPALQNAVQRQAEIVVQPGRVVLLNDKDVAHLVRRAPSRLGCRREVPLASIGFERHRLARLATRSGGLCLRRRTPARPFGMKGDGTSPLRSSGSLSSLLSAATSTSRGSRNGVSREELDQFNRGRSKFVPMRRRR